MVFFFFYNNFINDRAALRDFSTTSEENRVPEQIIIFRYDLVFYLAKKNTHFLFNARLRSVSFIWLDS